MVEKMPSIRDDLTEVKTNVAWIKDVMSRQTQTIDRLVELSASHTERLNSYRAALRILFGGLSSALGWLTLNLFR